MRTYHLLLSVFFFAIVGPIKADDPDAELKTRKVKVKKWLDEQPFAFQEKEAGLVPSLAEYRDACKIQMTYDTMKFGSPISFEFVLEKKTIITIEGHLNSVFRGNDGVLYFVHYHPNRSGGKVSAHDLKTGKKLWETILTAVGPIGHSAYTNQIAMNIQQKDLITIQGREAYGDYTEILDSKTGTLLANKLYREKYAPIK